MERRGFVPVAGLAAGTSQLRIADFGLRIGGPRTPDEQIRNSYKQSPTLSPAVFTHRIELLQEELKRRKLDLLVAEPSTNFQYLTGYNPGRSERLILLMLPAAGNPVVVCPSFEVERIRRNSAVSDLRGWQEQDNPWECGKTLGE